jgi:hypothetical protein
MKQYFLCILQSWWADFWLMKVFPTDSSPTDRCPKELWKVTVARQWQLPDRASAKAIWLTTSLGQQPYLYWQLPEARLAPVGLFGTFLEAFVSLVVTMLDKLSMIFLSFFLRPLLAWLWQLLMNFLSHLHPLKAIVSLVVTMFDKLWRKC